MLKIYRGAKYYWKNKVECQKCGHAPNIIRKNTISHKICGQVLNIIGKITIVCKKCGRLTNILDRRKYFCFGRFDPIKSIYIGDDFYSIISKYYLHISIEKLYQVAIYFETIFAAVFELLALRNYTWRRFIMRWCL